MESVPDHVLIKILNIGTETGRLDHTDICALAISNSHFDVLTQDSSLWATLISRDFPGSLRFFEVPSKALYKDRLEKYRMERKYEWKMKQLREQLLSIFDDLIEEIHNKWTDLYLDVQLDEIHFDSSSQNNRGRINLTGPITTGNCSNGINLFTMASVFYQWHQHILDAYSENNFMTLASILRMLPKAIASI